MPPPGLAAGLAVIVGTVAGKPQRRQQRGARLARPRIGLADAGRRRRQIGVVILGLAYQAGKRGIAETLPPIGRKRRRVRRRGLSIGRRNIPGRQRYRRRRVLTCRQGQQRQAERRADGTH